MADDLKHLDEHSNEIHELVETLVPHFPSIVDIQCGEKAILL